MAASGIITDVDQFTEPVRAPADGDPANGETFQDGLQDLANRTRYLKNRVDGHETRVGDLENALPTKVTAGSARYTVSGSGLSGNTRATLNQEFADTGFVLVGGNRITVPKIGRYMVTLNVWLTNSDMSNPLLIGAGFTVDGSLVLQTWTRRFSATAGDSLSVTCAGIIRITNIAEEIDVRPFGTGNFTVVGSSPENRFSIMSCGS